MLGEGGKISHKRWIAVTIAAILGWGISYSLMKAGNAAERYSVLVATMVFLLIITGVATVPQIISIIKGTPPPKESDDQPKNEQP